MNKRRKIRRKRTLRITMQMRRNARSLLVILAILVIVFIMIAGFLDMYKPSEPYGPADFYINSEEVSLDEFTNFGNRKGISLYLPSELPNNLKLTVIHLKEGPFTAIVVYSAEGNKDYKTAELIIEIGPSQFPPTYDELKDRSKESQYVTIQEVNGHLVYVNERAPSQGYIYGDFTLLVRVWIDELEYQIIAPTLTTDEVIQIIGSMKKHTS